MSILDGKRAFIVDLDGTSIFTPKEVFIERTQSILKASSLPQKLGEEILRFQNSHNHDRFLLEEWHLNEQEFHEFWRNYQHYMETVDEPGIKIYQDVLEALPILYKKGLLISIISSANPIYVRRWAERIESQTGIRFFPWVCTGNHKNIEHPRFEQKPCPDGLNYLLRTSGRKPDEVDFLGNHDIDIQFARNADCRSGLVDRGETPYSEKPDYKIKLFTDLL